MPEWKGVLLFRGVMGSTKRTLMNSRDIDVWIDCGREGRAAVQIIYETPNVMILSQKVGSFDSLVVAWKEN